MTPEHHDLVLAITSHLPHHCYNTVATAADLEEVTDSEVIKYSAGGFRDFTRIAASDPTMWRACSEPRSGAERAVSRIFRRCSGPSAGDGETLFNLFTWPAKCAEHHRGGRNRGAGLRPIPSIANRRREVCQLDQSPRGRHPLRRNPPWWCLSRSRLSGDEIFIVALSCSFSKDGFNKFHPPSIIGLVESLPASRCWASVRQCLLPRTPRGLGKFPLISKIVRPSGRCVRRRRWADEFRT